MSLWKLARIAIALTLLATACSSPEERAERARNAAQEALQRGDLGAALEALRDLRDTQPDTPEALLHYSNLLVLAGQAPEALWHLEAGVQRFPTRHALHLALARTALLVKSPSLARDTVDKVPPGASEHAQALLVGARAELELGNLEGGMALLQDAERLYPDQPETHLLRITTLISEGRTEDAEAELLRARQLPLPEETAEATQLTLRRLELNLLRRKSQEEEGREIEAALARVEALVDEQPNDLLGWQVLVEILTESGLTREAIERMHTALAEDPDRLALHGMLATAYQAQGDTERAHKALEAYVEASDSASARLLLARFNLERGEEEGALEAYRAVAATAPDKPRVVIPLIEALIWFQRLDEAQAEYEKIAEERPDDAIVEYARARIEMANGEFDAAASRLERIMPSVDSSGTQYWLGAALEAKGDFDGAFYRYGLAARRDPQDPNPRLAVIRLGMLQGDWRMVAGGAERLVRTSPGLLEVWMALGEALANLKEGESAERIAEGALARFPDQVDPYRLMARALRTQGRFDEALEVLDEGEEEFESSPLFDAERALTLGVKGEIDAGIAVTRKSLEAHPDSADLHFTQGALYFQQGRAEEGSRAIDRALELAPEDPRPLTVRANFRAATGRLQGSLEDGKRYLEMRPADPGAHFTMGVVLSQLGRNREAIASFRRSADLDEFAFAPRNNLAELLAQEGDLDGALEVAQEAYALAENNPYVMDTLGWLYLRKGLVARSISLFRDAYAIAPDLTPIQIHLALAHEEAGNTETAQELLAGLDSAPIEEARNSLR